MHQHSRSDALGQLQRSHVHREDTKSTVLLDTINAVAYVLFSCFAPAKPVWCIPEASDVRIRGTSMQTICATSSLHMVCSNITGTQAIQGQKICQVFQSCPWYELEQPEDGSVSINWVSPKEGHVLLVSYISGLSVRLGESSHEIAWGVPECLFNLALAMIWRIPPSLKGIRQAPRFKSVEYP